MSYQVRMFYFFVWFRRYGKIYLHTENKALRNQGVIACFKEDACCSDDEFIVEGTLHALEEESKLRGT